LSLVCRSSLLLEDSFESSSPETMRILNFHGVKSVCQTNKRNT
jgi:hypothetical protein